MDIVFRQEQLTAKEQALVTHGFSEHSAKEQAPDYEKDYLKWLSLGEEETIQAVLTAEVLWDWMYLNELWVSAEARGGGLGRQLVELAEEFANSNALEGIWLWTQSWQAEEFYKKLGYTEFTRFENFPKGYSRIGFRKKLG